MKYLKTFESVDEPQVGDYVICGIPGIDSFGDNKDIYKFISTTIGQLVEISNTIRPTYYVHYENVPEKIKWHKEYRYANTIMDKEPFRRMNITAWGKTPEDVKIKLSQNKYNL